MQLCIDNLLYNTLTVLKGIGAFENTLNFNGAIYLNNRKYKLNAYMLYILGNVLQETTIPLFRPQEGEGFIKDLTEAVAVGCNRKATLWGEANNPEMLLFRCLINPNDKNDGNFLVFVRQHGLGIVTSPSESHSFNAAAYADRLRKLGHYL